MNLKKPVILFALAAALSLNGADEPPLNSHLEPLRPLLGKTLKGTFTNSKPDKPVIDIQHWERVLNGQAVRLVHSINQGVYGGETIFVWDESKKAVTYYYFTTAGFMTTGTMEIKDGTFITREEVKGEAGGVTAVRATSQILPGGKFHVKAEHLKNDEWSLGHEVTYEEAPSAEVIFK